MYCILPKRAASPCWLCPTGEGSCAGGRPARSVSSATHCLRHSAQVPAACGYTQPYPGVQRASVEQQGLQQVKWLCQVSFIRSSIFLSTRYHYNTNYTQPWTRQSRCLPSRCLLSSGESNSNRKKIILSNNKCYEKNKTGYHTRMMGMWGKARLRLNGQRRLVVLVPQMINRNVTLPAEAVKSMKWDNVCKVPGT